MRKLAREAVIFMLLGPVVVFLVVFLYSQKQSVGGIRARAAQAVFATDIQPPDGYTVDNSVQVPLTNGVQLYVTDCNRLHPSGSMHGNDCVNFSGDDFFTKFGGRLTAVPLGDANQVAIEKKYWTAYAEAKREHRGENAMLAGVLSLYGFPGGLALWLLYRLVRFAVKG